MKFEDYPVHLYPIPEDEGEGYLVTIPDLPGCIADAETIAEARDAFKVWTTAAQEDKGDLPAPKTWGGQFVQRIPKTLHMQLSRHAANGRQLESACRESPCAGPRRATMAVSGLRAAAGAGVLRGLLRRPARSAGHPQG